MSVENNLRVNSMYRDEIRRAVKFMKTTKIRNRDRNYIEDMGWRGYICNLAPTRNGDGTYKYPQIDITRFGRNYARRRILKGKVLVHALWWRYMNGYRKIPTNLELSHVDASPKIILTVLETHEMNESRKYCHLNMWYKVLPGEQAPRCPHREYPCKGHGLTYKQWMDHRITQL